MRVFAVRYEKNQEDAVVYDALPGTVSQVAKLPLFIVFDMAAARQVFHEAFTGGTNFALIIHQNKDNTNRKAAGKFVGGAYTISPGDCDECEGRGGQPTSAGEASLEFLKRARKPAVESW